MIVTRNSQNIWNSLSDAWRSLEGRETIEGVWDTTSSGIDCLMQHAMDAQNSRAFEHMPSKIDDGPLEFTFIVSGLEDQINVLPSLTNELFRYYIDDWTISIPTMSQQYLSSGVMITHTYYEGFDYTISGMNTLRWLTIPLWDTRYPMVEALHVVAPIVYRINPVLMNTWARALDFDYDVFTSYDIYGNEQYMHLKYLIWALTYKRLQWPTLQNLQDGLSIAAGAPFAYNPGTVVYTGTGMTIGNDTYIIPGGMTRIADGTVVNKFDVLTEAIKLDDYYSNPGIIQTSIGTNALNQFRTVFIDLTLASLFDYNVDFFSYYRDTIIPIQLRKVYSSAIPETSYKAFISVADGINTTVNRLFHSTTSGSSSWSAQTFISSPISFAQINTTLFIGTTNDSDWWEGKVYRSVDEGVTWLPCISGFPDASVQALTVSGTTLFAGTFYSGIYRSTDFGDTWTAVNTGLHSDSGRNIYSLTVVGTNLFAGTEAYGVYISSDNGNNWSAVNNGIPHTGTNWYISSLASNGTELYAGCTSGKVFRSIDNGSNWSDVSSGLPSSNAVETILCVGSKVYVGFQSLGLYMSTNGGSGWTNIGSSLPNASVYSLAVSDSKIFVVTPDVGQYGNGGVWITSDDGQTWISKSTGLENFSASPIFITNIVI